MASSDRILPHDSWDFSFSWKCHICGLLDSIDLSLWRSFNSVIPVQLQRFNLYEFKNFTWIIYKFTTDRLKFRDSEEATKFWINLPIFFTLLSNVWGIGRLFSILWPSHNIWTLKWKYPEKLSILLGHNFTQATKLVHKAHIFWKGNTVLWNLHLTFDWHYIGQKQGGDFAKFCGLLRIYEL
jgi:hypothetical protein